MKKISLRRFAGLTLPFNHPFIFCGIVLLTMLLPMRASADFSFSYSGQQTIQACSTASTVSLTLTNTAASSATISSASPLYAFRFWQR